MNGPFVDNSDEKLPKLEIFVSANTSKKKNILKCRGKFCLSHCLVSVSRVFFVFLSTSSITSTTVHAAF